MNSLMINDDCNYKVANKRKSDTFEGSQWNIFCLMDEKRESLAPLKFLSWSSRVLSAAGTCKLSSTTSCPPPSHTDAPGSPDSYWLSGSSERGRSEGSAHNRSDSFTSQWPPWEAFWRRSWTLKAMADTICRGSTDGRLFRQRTQCHLEFLHQWLTSTLVVWHDGWDGWQLEFLHTTAATMINARHQAIVCKTRGCEAPRRADTVLTLSCV